MPARRLTQGGGETVQVTETPAEAWMADFDVECFLRESTQAMWERKMLGGITELYAPHVLVHLGADVALHGSEELLERSVEWLAAFPDLRVFIDDPLVVRRDAALLTSLRWTAVGHNNGPSIFGPATGRRVVVTGIVNARIEQGRYVEQWIEVGDGDLVHQLGCDQRSITLRLWSDEGSSDFGEVVRQTGVVTSAGRTSGRLPEGSGAALDVGPLIDTALNTIWNQRQIGEVERFFALHYRERGPGRRQLFGREELQGEILSLLGIFPDLRLYIDEVLWDGDGETGARSSTRWTLLGTNTSATPYGPPTNSSLRLSGITNHRIAGGQFVEGWTAYSELNLAHRLIRLAPPTPADAAGE